jgi:hypothetical protein
LRGPHSHLDRLDIEIHVGPRGDGNPEAFEISVYVADTRA